MPLANKQWTPISVHSMVLEFLRSERHKFPPELQSLIDEPNLENHFHNNRRMWMLYRIRAPFIGEIPLDTQWFDVVNLEDEDLDQLLVVGRGGWDDPADENELRKVAARRPQALSKPPADWPKPILWGHDRNGPFTIFEGNKRFTSFVSSQPAGGMRIPVIIGLSPTPCFWHRPDPPYFLCNDMWRQFT
jgi:hypothetical protein